ncbi:serine family amino acid catabolism-related protein [Tothia fuscella]|uniref:L-serine ammonia-lyase n=1 Tax=Tothia fuscella TaxID=1048955 RepID=A0A9P4P1N4_9PEZI|nr:serine family amino acid catabolism-related protein [Tothia fuscella]
MSSEKKVFVETPLHESAALSKAAGCRIFLKLENLQPSGSFKSRGIGHYLSTHLKANGSTTGTHFYSSSGGNAGLACVVAARTLGYPASVVVPLSTKPMMITKIKAVGATEVIQIGASWQEADSYLREVILVENKNGVYVPPFDHPAIWAGHSTIVPEIMEQLSRVTSANRPDAIVCSVGGGGLFAGIVQGLDAAGCPDVPILAVETAGAESLNAALKAGELITLPGINSQATSLGAVRVSERAFEYAQRSNVRSAVYNDAEAAMGCWRLADDERLMVELACGVNVAVCYGGRLEKALGKKLTTEDKVVIVLCGGSNVTVDMLAGWRKEYAYIEKEQAVSNEIPSSLTAPNGHRH